MVASASILATCMEAGCKDAYISQYAFEVKKERVCKDRVVIKFNELGIRCLKVSAVEEAY